MHLTKTFAVRAVLLSLVVGVLLMPATHAAASEPCSEVTGEGTFGEGPEKQRLKNTLFTDTAAKGQKLIFSWERGKHIFILREPEGASCVISKRAATFRGRGEGTVNGVPEFVANYMIRIDTEEVVTLKIKILQEKSREVVAEFEDEGLEGSTEAIA
jgi:hypothetical protein